MLHKYSVSLCDRTGMYIILLPTEDVKIFKVLLWNISCTDITGFSGNKNNLESSLTNLMNTEAYFMCIGFILMPR